MINNILLSILFILGIANPVFGEILEVVVAWNSGTCTDNCPALLEQYFKKIKQAEDVKVNPGAGIAVFKWKPKASLTYQTIKTPMQMVGVGLNDIRVRVRGKAHRQGKGVALSSIGDGTLFTLVNTPAPSSHEYTTFANPIFLELSPELQQKLLSEAQHGKVMVIEGPLYEPHRSPPLYLVVEKIQIEKKNP